MTTHLAAVPMCACERDAAEHDGWVHPNRVHALLLGRFGDVSPQWFSSQWAPACGVRGFLDKSSVEVAIDPTHSRGNGGKTIFLRRLRVTS